MLYEMSQTQNDKCCMWELGAEGEGEENKEAMAVEGEGIRERWKAILKHHQRGGSLTGEMAQ